MNRPTPFAYLLITHGSRDKEDREVFFRFVEKFRKAFPNRRVEPAFLGRLRPSVAEGIKACVQAGAQEIFVLPWVPFPSRRVSEDIPLEIQAGKRRFPEVDFHYTGPLAQEKLTRTFSPL